MKTKVPRVTVRDEYSHPFLRSFFETVALVSSVPDFLE